MLAFAQVLRHPHGHAEYPGDRLIAVLATALAIESLIKRTTGSESDIAHRRNLLAFRLAFLVTFHWNDPSSWW